ncbi:pentapeptide repeat-containing protein [Micromonospora sp. NPDC049081]|uniref:pentapeptide repeat-containing protein n=1 Tax=Micromonospora sp. NPDC049081 TaxID=3155150 RepID=UPI0033D0FAE0
MRRKRKFPQDKPESTRSSFLTGARPAPWVAVFLLALVPLIFGATLGLANPSNTILPDIGASLIGGAITGLVFAFVQYTMAQRNQSQEKEADLRLLLTSSINLPGIDLSGRRLTDAYLRGKNLESAQLVGSDLTHAVLDRIVLDGADLTDADLSRATMKAARAREARMSRCRLTQADLSGTDLTGSVLSAAVLDDADLSGGHLSGADLTLASLLRTDLEDAQLDGAQFRYVRATSVRLAGARLTGAVLHFADLGGGHLARADLTGAQLLGANLSEAVLTLADLSGAELTGASLIRADLTGCKAIGAVLRSVDLRGAILTGCDLRGADLTDARLDEVQGRCSARSDERTRWPEDDLDGASPQSVDEKWMGVRRVLLVPATPHAADTARDIAAEMARQQSLSRQVAGVRMSLPLTVRPPRALRVRAGRLSLRIWSTAAVRVSVARGAIIASVTFRGRSCTLPPVPIERGLTSGVPDAGLKLTAIDEVTARILNVVDPRDGASWFVRACATASNRIWIDEGRPSTARCRRILLSARQADPLSPVVNYALGALGYNEYEVEPTKTSLEHFAVAYASSGRLAPGMDGLIGLCLTGTALANCQLYHRFGMETPGVLAASRSAAANAVAKTRERLKQRNLSRRVYRNAMEGYALARYAEAFAQHVTEEEDDVRSSIPIYEDAIETLRAVNAPVPAVLYNNLGYQHMTEAGLKERGSDAQSYRKARAYFLESLKAHPDLHFGWANLGNVDRLLGNPAAAEKSYQRALAIVAAEGGRYPQGWNELACVLLDLGGRDDDAWTAHRQAVTEGSAPAVRAKLRAEFASRLILVRHPDKAAEVAQEGLADDPGNRYCLQALEEAQSAS